MISENVRSRRQAREARLPLIAELYKRGLSIRKICAEVNARLNMKVSPRTVHNDEKLLLEEWREQRMASIDELVSLELARIDDCVVELWDQWEKSKENYSKVTNGRIGVPSGSEEGGAPDDGEQKIVTLRMQQSDTNVVACGNPAYMAEIRQQLAERRKLLGLYDNRSKLDITSGGQPINTSFTVEVISRAEDVERQAEE